MLQHITFFARLCCLFFFGGRGMNNFFVINKKYRNFVLLLYNNIKYKRKNVTKTTTKKRKLCIKISSFIKNVSEVNATATTLTSTQKPKTTTFAKSYKIFIICRSFLVRIDGRYNSIGYRECGSWDRWYISAIHFADKKKSIMVKF